MTSWHGFTQAFIEEYTLLRESRNWPEFKTPAGNIMPIVTADYLTPAARPANSKLNCNKISTTFGLVLPEWSIVLKETMVELALIAS